MRLNFRYVAWPLLLLAILTWCAVGLFVWVILTDEEDRATSVQSMQETESKEASALRLYSLAQDTAQKREQLDKIFHTDVVSMVDMIESAGKTAGAKLVVSNVQTQDTPLAQTASGSPIIATGFVVEAQGTFPSIMHLVRLFETLPVPSKLDRLDVERTSAATPGASGLWRINAHLNVLTTSDTTL